MNSWILNRDADGNVDYLLVTFDGTPVTGKMAHYNAVQMLKRGGKVMEDHTWVDHGVNITSDGQYYFHGQCEVLPEPELGADGCPIPAKATNGAEQPQKAQKKRRMKDVVCE